MGLRIPDDIISATSELPLRDVILAYTGIELDSRGFGYSPFREQSSGTSFSIRENTGHWRDWELNLSGKDAISFVSKYKGVSFRESVIDLAVTFGIITKEEAKKFDTSKRIRDIVICEPLKPKPKQEEFLSPLREEEYLDKIYRKIIELSPLKDTDRIYLHQRGITDAEIEEHMFFSTPNYAIASKLRRAGYSWDDVKGVPGFFKRTPEDEVYAFLSKGSASGIALPCINVNGNIVGIQNRNPNPEAKVRYTWVSSTIANGLPQGKDEKTVGFYGCGPGAPIDFIKKGNRLVITEGIFKSVVLTRPESWDFSVASVQGVGNWKNIGPIINMFEDISIAFDADALTKEGVCLQLESLANHIKETVGNEPFIMCWKEDFGKGIDDVILGGYQDEVKSIPFSEWIAMLSEARITASKENIPVSEAWNRYF